MSDPDPTGSGSTRRALVAPLDRINSFPFRTPKTILYFSLNTGPSSKLNKRSYLNRWRWLYISTNKFIHRSIYSFNYRTNIRKYFIFLYRTYIKLYYKRYYCRCSVRYCRWWNIFRKNTKTFNRIRKSRTTNSISSIRIISLINT